MLRVRNQQEHWAIISEKHLLVFPRVSRKLRERTTKTPKYLYAHVYGWDKWELRGIEPPPEVFEVIKMVPNLEIM